MISVIVTYKVTNDFVTRNKENITKFISEFKKLKTSEFEYKVFTKQDGLTFVHHSIYKNEQIQKELLRVPAFLKFQKQRDEIGIEGSPKIEFLDLLGSTRI